MVFDPGLIHGSTLSNQELCSLFRCSTQGGMRRSRDTNTLVLIAKQYHDRDVPYYDTWDGSIFHYTGMGMQGDQSLDITQNKTLTKSRQLNDLGIFLFEVFSPKIYTYQGQVMLAGEPYQRTQGDINKQPRKVWIFPLKLVNKDIPTPIPEETFEIISQQREKSANKLSNDELKKRAERSNAVPGERTVIAKRFERDPNVVLWVKRRANGICQLCQSHAPFVTKQGDPFLETHHIIPLGQDGMDTIENTVALCPNCHRKMHALNLVDDKYRLIEIAKSI
jgi:5-methylcytosine-specific restriction enzyme A